MAMRWVLATTTNKVKWFAFTMGEKGFTGEFELLDVLDMRRVTLFHDKPTARDCAKALRLKGFKYARI